MLHTRQPGQLPNIDPHKLVNPYKDKRLKQPILGRLSDTIEQLNSPGGVVYNTRQVVADRLAGLADWVNPKQK